MSSIIDDFAAINRAGPTAEPIPQDNEDAVIVALFERWFAARRAADPLDDDDEWEEQLQRADVIEAKILLTRCSGAAGLAIKLYLAMRMENSGCGDIIHVTHNPGELCALRDAVRFAPILEPLCRDYLARETRALGDWILTADLKTVVAEAQP
ncbi:MAG TPA: hypothetical protein VMF05_06035 [Stellaceae bacterium]|nr:hypothetical protein [Stellaceae bacterium]